MTETSQEPEKQVEQKYGLAVVEKDKEGKDISVSFIANNLSPEIPLTYDDPEVAQHFLESEVFPGVFGEPTNVEVRPLSQDSSEIRVIVRHGIHAQEGSKEPAI